MNVNDAEEIYRMYPKKRDKRFAIASIQRAIRRIEEGETGQRMMYCDAVLYLLAAVQEFADSPAGQRGQFTPYPATWVNRSSYMDRRSEWQHLNREEEQTLRMNREANVGVFRP